MDLLKKCLKTPAFWTSLSSFVLAILNAVSSIDPAVLEPINVAWLALIGAVLAAGGYSQIKAVN
jgi:hypothetical protein